MKQVIILAAIAILVVAGFQIAKQQEQQEQVNTEAPQGQNSFTDQAQDAVNEAAEVVNEAAEQAVEATKEAAETVSDKAGELAKDTTEAVSETTENAAEAVKEATEATKEGAEKAGEYIGEKYDAAKDAVKDATTPSVTSEPSSARTLDEAVAPAAGSVDTGAQGEIQKQLEEEKAMKQQLDQNKTN